MKKIKVKIKMGKMWYSGMDGGILMVTEAAADHLYEFTNTLRILKSDCEVVEEATPQPVPFDLERAKKGEPVITRKGAKGKYICTITKGRTNPIHVFEINTGPDHDCSWTYCYSQTGCYQSGEGLFEQTTSDDENLDLFMAPKEPEYVEGWVVVSPYGIIGTVFSTINSAQKSVGDNSWKVEKIKFPKP